MLLTCNEAYRTGDTSATATDEDDVVEIVVGFCDGCHSDYRTRCESSQDLLLLLAEALFDVVGLLPE